MKRMKMETMMSSNELTEDTLEWFKQGNDVEKNRQQALEDECISCILGEYAVRGQRLAHFRRKVSSSTPPQFTWEWFNFSYAYPVYLSSRKLARSASFMSEMKLWIKGSVRAGSSEMVKAFSDLQDTAEPNIGLCTRFPDFRGILVMHNLAIEAKNRFYVHVDSPYGAVYVQVFNEFISDIREHVAPGLSLHDLVD